MTRAPMFVGDDDEGDSIAVLQACWRWPEAESEALARLEALRATPTTTTLALARATRRVADVLIDSGRAEQATAPVVEARGLYRPFAREPGPAAEIHWTLARHAFATRRSAEAEAALGVALQRTEGRPELGMWRARALRFRAHMLLLRGDFSDGARDIDEALAAVRAAGDTGALLLLDLLFTRAEVHVILEEPARAREMAARAFDFLESRFRAEGALREHGRARVARILAESGDREPGQELGGSGPFG